VGLLGHYDANNSRVSPIALANNVSWASISDVQMQTSHCSYFSGVLRLAGGGDRRGGVSRVRGTLWKQVGILSGCAGEERANPIPFCSTDPPFKC